MPSGHKKLLLSKVFLILSGESGEHSIPKFLKSNQPSNQLDTFALRRINFLSKLLNLISPTEILDSCSLAFSQKNN